eukprot:CAMPEP_0204625744 /NCGR_PEP_ID=MMETSP0717-20131115/11434_1 /ASSEMBLY_ACC=CAM_ASM_000666 /TAXON_ID=230516 /ORGANISM="Chaetoceros curvisetus" /LENGTH=335 /DNA_ID=CAMNT_0051641513 /DNA_START=219 /DNA_END=1226 /DNA_ORIENTATION=-
MNHMRRQRISYTHGPRQPLLGVDPLILAIFAPLIIVVVGRTLFEIQNAIERFSKWLEKRKRAKFEKFQCFEQLPDDLQLCVLDYLDVPELGAIALVSKKMNTAAQKDRYWDKHLTHLLTECYDGSFQYVRDKTRKEKKHVIPITFAERFEQSMSPRPLANPHSSLVSWYSDWGAFFHRYPMKVLMSFNAILSMRKEDTVPDWLKKHDNSRGTYVEAGRAIYRIWKFEEEFAKIMGQCIDCRDMAKDCQCWRRFDCNKWKRRSRLDDVRRGIEAMPDIRLFRDSDPADGCSTSTSTGNGVCHGNASCNCTYAYGCGFLARYYQRKKNALRANMGLR